MVCVQEGWFVCTYWDWRWQSAALSCVVSSCCGYPGVLELLGLKPKTFTASPR